MKPLVVRLRTMSMLRKRVKSSADQETPVATEPELACAVHDSFPKFWKNSLQRSNSKSVDVVMEQLARCMEAFDAKAG